MEMRQRVWVDKRVQGVLIGRIVLYWAAAMLYVGLGTVCFQYYQHPDWSLVQHAQELFLLVWPWLPSAVLCLPLVVFDIIRVSNLFVGPIYRLRSHLSELHLNPDCPPLKFRDDDYWHDLTEPIHRLQSELLARKSEVARLRQLADGKLSATDASAITASIAEQVAKLAAMRNELGLGPAAKKTLPAIGASLESPAGSI